MQFAIGVTVLECSFVKHSHGRLGVNNVKKIQFFSKFKKINKIKFQDRTSYNILFDVMCFKICKIMHDIIKLNINFMYQRHL
jgi:hypothetical protein